MTDSEQTAHQDSERKALQIFAVLVALIPLSLGIDMALLGLQGMTIQFVHAYNGPIVPELDSTFRFLAIQFLGFGLILLWTIPKLEARAIPFRIIALSFVLGGLARLISRFAIGNPYIYVSLVNSLEVLIGSILLIWHWRVVNRGFSLQPGKERANG